jgi:exodeoxyribonuclease VII small subunit
LSVAKKDAAISAAVDAQMTFEQAQAELEGLIARIESGQIGLEESMAAHERGIALLRHCRGILDKAEQTFTDLTEKAKG